MRYLHPETLLLLDLVYETLLAMAFYSSSTRSEYAAR